MIVNTKVRYGLRTILEIAMSSGASGILQKDIAVNQEISVKYLDQIISSLKIAGLIANVGGRKTGYRLTRQPSAITVYDVWRAMQPDICILDCLSETYTCDRSRECMVKPFWNDLNQLIIGHLQATTIKDLLESKVRLCEV